MDQQRWWKGVLMMSILLVAYGCAPQAAPGLTSAGQVHQTIPADSPLASIREGMSKAEMLSLLGPPTDQDTSITGKAFIPFYFGGDATATRLHYKGLGQCYGLLSGMIDHERAERSTRRSPL
jgi:hypothetical protein